MHATLLIAGMLCAAASGAAPENIALGAPYTLAPAPNYAHCTEPGDAVQLTDGVYTEGHFWTQASTVGWSGTKPIIITIDLGVVRPIRGVSYNTAAGMAGVTWPESIYLLTAGQDKRYHEVGELVSLSAKQGPPPGAYATHRFQTDALKTHGRYVALVVEGSPFIFVDEIEVFAGAPEWTALPLNGQGVADLTDYISELRIRRAVMRRMQRDAAAVLREVEGSGLPRRVRKRLLNELDDVLMAAKRIPKQYGDEFRAVLPLNAGHARIFGVHAALWRASGCKPLLAWPYGAWDPLPLLLDPPKAAQFRIEMKMMPNEFRSAAFNLSNAEAGSKAVSLRISGLPGGENPPWITMQEVAWTDTASGQPVAAALPAAPLHDGAFRIAVEPGLTRQVWLTFHPVDLAPGSYEGAVQIRDGDTALEVPLAVTIYPMRFPDRPRLHFGGWDYTDQPSMYQVTPENRGLLIQHLREHYVDSPWATGAVLPFGEYDAAGTLKTPPDTTAFDSWQKLWPDAAQYCVFPAVGKQLGSFTMGTPEFETAVKAWCAFWADHLRGAGLKPEQLALLLVDEPQEPEQDAVILAWAKAVRASNTGLRVWEDPIYHDMGKSNPEMLEACHVLCPNRQIFLGADQAYREVFLQQHARGATLEFYSCSGPARLLDPYRYYRLQGWDCWRYGATASYFWAFGDGGGASSWNEYLLPRSAYTPLFLDATTVTPGKQMEACREGLEDYEYLAMLQDAVNGAAARGVTGGPIDEAKKLLAELPEQVASKDAVILWFSGSTDRSLADAARVKILDCLAALGQSGP